MRIMKQELSATGVCWKGKAESDVTVTLHETDGNLEVDGILWLVEGQNGGLKFRYFEFISAVNWMFVYLPNSYVEPPNP